MQKIIGRFRAQGEDGLIYDVIEMQDMVDARTKDGDDWLPGLKWTELPNGRKLNTITDGVYQIVSTGVIVRRMG